MRGRPNPSAPHAVDRLLLARQHTLITRFLQQAFANRDYIVYESERVTYAQAHARVRHQASFLHSLGVRKGTKVALCLRNCPDWILAFFAIHSLGGVVVAVNGFNTAEVMAHCVKASGCEVALVDGERMRALSGWRDRLGCRELLVVKAEGKVEEGFRSLDEALAGFKPSDIGKVDIEPEDPATIFFTSGTSGMPKGVLSTQRQFISNLLNSLVAGARAILRAGGELVPPEPDAIQRAYLLVSRTGSRGYCWTRTLTFRCLTMQPVPLMHVMGCQGALMVTSFYGGKVCSSRSPLHRHSR